MKKIAYIILAFAFLWSCASIKNNETIKMYQLKFGRKAYDYGKVIIGISEKETNINEKVYHPLYIDRVFDKKIEPLGFIRNIGDTVLFRVNLFDIDSAYFTAFSSFSTPSSNNYSIEREKIFKDQILFITNSNVLEKTNKIFNETELFMREADVTLKKVELIKQDSIYSFSVRPYTLSSDYLIVNSIKYSKKKGIVGVGFETSYGDECFVKTSK